MRLICSICSRSPEVLGDATVNLSVVALNLERGHSFSFECDECLYKALYKDEEGRL